MAKDDGITAHARMSVIVCVGLLRRHSNDLGEKRFEYTGPDFRLARAIADGYILLHGFASR